MNENVRACPLCGGTPALRMSSEKSGGKCRTVYGYVCPTKDCPWSFAYTVYPTLATAEKEWNLKVESKEQLLRWDDRLNSCPCGGKAKLVYERYGYGYGLWFVRCDKCQRGLSGSETMDAIIAAWNGKAREEENV